MILMKSIPPSTALILIGVLSAAVGQHQGSSALRPEISDLQLTTLQLRVYRHLTRRSTLTNENETAFSSQGVDEFQEQQKNRFSNAQRLVNADPVKSNDNFVHLNSLEDNFPSANPSSERRYLKLLKSRIDMDMNDLNVTYNNQTSNVSELFTTSNRTTNETDYDLSSFLMIKAQVDTTIVSIIAVIGLIGNIPMVIILFTHPEMRTMSNVPIFSMAAGDFLSIIVNLLGFFCFFLVTNQQWTFGVYFCKFFFFASDLSVGLSIFGLTALSVQRYCGILASPFVCSRTSNSCFSKRMKICHVLLVWIASFVLALRTFITSDVVNGKCVSISDLNILKILAVPNFLAFCLIPLCVLVVFHVLTARHLFSSAKKIPGDDHKKQRELKYAREKSARIILALTCVFFISYVPWFLWQVVFVLGKYDFDDIRVIYAYWLLYYFFFGNICFNPIALCCISHRFRKLFQGYLCRCGINRVKVIAKAMSRTKESSTTGTTTLFQITETDV